MRPCEVPLRAELLPEAISVLVEAETAARNLPRAAGIHTRLCNKAFAASPVNTSPVISSGGPSLSVWLSRKSQTGLF